MMEHSLALKNKYSMYSLVLLFWRFDGASSVVQGIPAACVRAQLPSDGGLTLTCEDYWPDSSWYPLTASDQSLGLIIQHLHLVNSKQWGATLESPWVFKVFTLTLYASLQELRLLVDVIGGLDTCWVIII